jgi:predicted GNAT family acetyltransferase
MESASDHVLRCTEDGLRQLPALADVELVYVHADSSAADIRENLTVNEQSFDPASPEVRLSAAEKFRAQLAECTAITLRRKGHAVAGGMRLPVRGGRAELVGIGTLAAHRRHGYGAAVTVALARDAFAHGAEEVFLSTDDPEALRVYQRVGFTERPPRPGATGLGPGKAEPGP